MSEIVIIPAAGSATRLRPISNSMSKAMVPVAGKPILAHILSSLRGNADTVVVVYGQNEDIPTFLESKDYGFELKLVRQNREVLDGPLGAIATGVKEVDVKDGDIVTVWLGDTLLASQEETDAIFYCREKSLCTVLAAPVTDFSRWCMVGKNDGEVEYYDKSKTRPPTNLALIGVYRFLSESFMEKLRSSLCMSEGHLEISNLLSLYKHTATITEVKSWLDCGDLPSLHSANAALINEKSRAHNSVKINGQMITKGLSNDNEVSWYEAVQGSYAVRNVTPQFLGKNADGTFNLELCSGSTLQDMVVYDNVRGDCWDFIIRTVVGAYLSAFNEPVEAKFDPHHMFRWNILKRFERIPNLPRAAYEFLDRTYCMLETRGVEESKIIHGDFHFGNIIYDASCNKVKLIDPRGEWNGIKTTAGCTLYDFAKFYQSIYAEYAWVVAGEPTNELLRAELLKSIDSALSSRREVTDLAKRYAVILQLSAIPLHYDNPARQQRMLDTSMKLILEWK